MAVELGFLNILVGLGLKPGTGEKLGDEVDKSVGGAGEKAGKSFAEAFSKQLDGIGSKISKNITAPVVAGAGALFAATMKVDEAYDGIRIKTGATGEELEGLKDSFDNVARSVPNAFGEIEPAFSTLAQRLGLVGKPLEDLTRQVLNIGELTGEAVDPSQVADLLTAFTLPVEEQSAALDVLFRASQASGVAFQDLAALAAENAPVFQELGYTYEESVAFLANLEKQGANSAQVLAGLKKAAVNSLGAGEDVAKINDKIADSTAKIQDAEGDLAVQTQKLAELRAKAGSKSIQAANDVAEAEANLAKVRSDPKATADKILKAENAVTEARNKAAQTDASAILAVENNIAKLQRNIEAEKQTLIGYQEAVTKSAQAGAGSTGDFVEQSVDQIKQLLAAGDEEAAKVLASDIFGPKAFIPILKQIREGTFDVDNFTKSLTAGTETVAGLTGEVRDAPETFQQFKNQLLVDLAAVGEEALPDLQAAAEAALPAFKDILVELATVAKEVVPVIADVVKSVLPIIKEFAQRFKDLSPETKKTVGTLVAFTAVLGPVLGPIGKLVGVFGNLLKVFKLLNFAALANPWVLALVGVAAIAFIVIKNWGPIKDFFLALFDAIKSIFVAFKDFVVLLFAALGFVFVKVWEGLVAGAKFAVDVIVGFFSLLVTAFTAIWDAMVFVAQAFWDGLVAIVQFAVDVIVGIWNAIVGAFTAVWDLLVAGAQIAVDLVIGYFQFLFDVYSGIWEAISKVGQAVWDGLVTAAKFVVEKVIAVFKPLVNFYKGIWDAILKGAQVVAGFIVKVFRAAWDALVKGAKAVAEFIIKAFKSVTDFVGKIVKGILDLPGKLKGALQRIPGASYLPGLAEGGPAKAGQAYIVGERGPELMVPRASGTVIPNDQLRGLLGTGGGGDEYTINIVNPVPEPAATSIPAALRRAAYLRSR